MTTTKSEPVEDAIRKTAEELMADRVEEAMLTDRDTRYQLMRRILEANDRHLRLNVDRMSQIDELRRELSAKADTIRAFESDRDIRRMELTEAVQRSHFEEHRADTYLRTLADLMQIDTDDRP